MTPAEKIRLLRRLTAAVAALAAAFGFTLLWWHSPLWKTWLFDLSIATVLAAAVHLATRRAIAAELRSHKRVLVAITLSITGAAAVIGIFAITITDRPAGLHRIAALLIVQGLGAVIGGAIGFVDGLFTAAVVRGISTFFRGANPALDGAVIGALSGTLGGIPFLEFPNLGWWFVAASAAWCSYCGCKAGSEFVAEVPASQSTT